MIDNTLNELSRLCIEQHLQVSTAESCTGGLVAKLITDRPGSSQWFERGFITYSNLAKEEMLAVDSTVLSTEGAVSEPVAKAMAIGALTHSQAQLSVSITGIAGPEGGSVAKPVGLVCFGWAYYLTEDATKKSTKETANNAIIIADTEQQIFSGDREAVRNQSAFFALQKLLEIIS